MIQLARDVFESLRVVHVAGVVHCDVKSMNFLVKQENLKYRAVLTDFGVCRVLHSANVVAGMKVNSVRGKSIAYCAPEWFVASTVPQPPD